ncbi:MAG TPA: IPT/TIG domain-containing protein [Candidatus Solibacter sp.]|nr:IPT/TIG domain-containing protein [Candidatus Solibacter sp.]
MIEAGAEKLGHGRSGHLCLAGVILAAFLTGCGGGNSGGGGGGGGGGQPPPKIPTLSAIAPATTTVGAASFTLSLYGSNFNQDSFEVLWNGTPLPAVTTTWVSSTVLTAAVPAANLASVGSAKVSVVNGSTGGGTATSDTQTFTITAPPAGTTWVRTVSGVAEAHDLVWDSAHSNLYVSVGASDPIIPNTVVPINPITGMPGTPVAAGNDPYMLSISSDSSYLWVSPIGSVQRFLLPNLATDISFQLPLNWRGELQQATSMQAAPVNPHTLALVAGTFGYSPPGDGVYVYDDATQRPVFAAGSGPGGGIGNDWIQWGADDSVIYGNGFDAAINTLTVTPSGVSVTNVAQGDVDITETQYVSSTGLLYNLDGAYNPPNSSLVSSFDLPAVIGTACTADGSLGRYYCVVSYFVGGTDLQKFELWVYDLSTHALVDRVLFGLSAGAMISPITGFPGHIVRWGNAGLTLVTVDDTARGKGGVFLIDGAAVNPNVAPDVSSGTVAVTYSWMTSVTPQQVSSTNADLSVTINGTNFPQDSTVCYDCGFALQQYLPTTYVSPQQLKATIPASLLTLSLSLAAGPIQLSVFDPGTNTSSSDALAVTVGSVANTGTVSAINLSGLNMAWDDARQLLYVGVADWDSAYPNSILTVDGSMGAIVDGQNVASDPDLMSISAGGQYLYTGFAGSTNMTQFQLPGLVSPLTWGLIDPSSPAVFYAGDLKAAPQSPHSSAVVLLNFGSTTPEVGVVAYDDSVVRSEYAQSWVGFPPVWYDTVAWGATDDVLAGAPSNVPSGGPLSEFQVSPMGVALQATGTDAFNAGTMHSDFGTGLIYSDDGNVADPSTQAIVGTYAASGLVVPDSTLNRVFILGQTAAQTNTTNFTIQAFNEKTYGWTSQIVLNNLLGFPVALARWGTTGLAVLTMNVGSGPAGMLYLIQEPTLLTDASQAGFSGHREFVRRRWRPISKADIVRRVHKAKLGGYGFYHR